VEIFTANNITLLNEQKYRVQKGDLILRVFGCVVTISFGVYLVLRLFNLFCNMWGCVWGGVVMCMCGFCNVCVCVCVGFVMYVCMCGYFGNMCTSIYCVLYCLYCVIVLFRLCIFILICFVCTGVRTAATE